ncbi:MAG: hypothetical protein Unbinned5081contig1002_19 [Prokaryotic dsDNA virus sp.]|nr:MAG: hypothetical protein Unbinned5081contig1002_19 [Prokaryotic dsDNA virus sp.]|tara:strand:- start:2519 stop:2698 length:180 start_codon:yes stop_codon:yes gene_type:complete
MITLKIIIAFISLGASTELHFSYQDMQSCIGHGEYKVKALKEAVYYDTKDVDINYICEE